MTLSPLPLWFPPGLHDPQFQPGMFADTVAHLWGCPQRSPGSDVCVSGNDIGAADDQWMAGTTGLYRNQWN